MSESPSSQHRSFIPGSEEELMRSRTSDDEEVIASFLARVPKTAPLIPMSLPEGAPPSDEAITDRQKFWIRVADTKERREQAGLLVDRMYAWRGYTHENILRETPHTITLVSYGRDGRVIGTVSIGMDAPGDPLLAEEGYPEEIAKLRAQGKKVAEFNGLAVDSEIRSKLVIARLFHIAMLYPYGLFGYTDCIIEVTPAHARFYERMLEFDRLGKERICPRVNATGVLMHKNFVDAAEKLKKVGGLLESGDHTLYSYGFSSDEAQGILGRLRRMQSEPEMAS